MAILVIIVFVVCHSALDAESTLITLWNS